MSNSSFEIQGRLFEKFSIQQITDKFKKVEFILEVPDGSFTQYIKMQFTQDKCSLLDSFKAGDEVKVHFNLQGKPFVKNGTTSYFTNIGAWRIEPASGGYASAPASTAAYGNDDSDSLPF